MCSPPCADVRYNQNCPFILAKCVCNRCTMLYSVCYFKIFGGRKAKAMLNQFWRVWGREADRNLPRTAVEFSRIFNPFRFSKGPEKQLGLDNQNKVLHLSVETIRNDQMLLLLLLFFSGIVSSVCKVRPCKVFQVFSAPSSCAQESKDNGMAWPVQCSTCKSTSGSLICKMEEQIVNVRAQCGKCKKK